jgi:hypothetical protein
MITAATDSSSWPSPLTILIILLILCALAWLIGRWR